MNRRKSIGLIGVGSLLLGQNAFPSAWISMPRSLIKLHPNVILMINGVLVVKANWQAINGSVFYGRMEA